MTLRHFIELAYNGTGFHGWQRQLNAPSVQEAIENALSTILRTDTPIVGCGRTDTGVHASTYFAHFDTDTPLDRGKLIHRLNAMLSEGIAIMDILPVADTAHARFSATQRTYVYRITQIKDPFGTKLLYRFSRPLDATAMNKACQRLLGTHDFGCFCKSNTDNLNDICTVTEAFWTVNGHTLTFRISANRFLRNMVRAIVGTMLEIGQHRISLDEFDGILASKDRSSAGPSVPAHGLYLTAVQYPPEIFLQRP